MTGARRATVVAAPRPQSSGCASESLGYLLKCNTAVNDPAGNTAVMNQPAICNLDQ